MPKNVFDTEKKTCDRCGFDHKKSSLRKQRGLWLSDDCFDITDRIKSPRTRWQNPRENDTTTTIPAESTPEVFTVSSGTGINLLSQSHELSERRDGRHISIFMKVVSDGGAISISADPQIVAAAQLGDLLTLRGTSDTDTITLVSERGLRLKDGSGGTAGLPFTLADRDAISFVYMNVLQGWGSMAWGSDPWGDGSGGLSEVPMWVETSRFKGGV
jgi:hypothetical protein